MQFIVDYSLHTRANVLANHIAVERSGNFLSNHLKICVRTTQLRLNVAAVASRWRVCADLTCPGFKPQTFRTDRKVLTIEQTGGFHESIFPKIFPGVIAVKIRRISLLMIRKFYYDR